MALRIAVKRLSAVETDPGRSHQHEFHAGELRRELGLPAERWSGPLGILILRATSETPVVDETVFTLYDARERNLERSEWHLYYVGDVIPTHAAQGDLLLLYRYDHGLRAVIARAGTQPEHELLRALELGEDAVRERFRFLDVPLPDETESRLITGQLTPHNGPIPGPIPAGLYDVTDHALFHRASREGAVPNTREMASAADEIARNRGAGPNDPDDYLFAALRAETDLYFAIEDEVQRSRYEQLAATRPNLTEILDFAMSIQQSRKSRRGQSLQNHFATLLRASGIPFTEQCQTEPGERPDFLVPGCPEYHDAHFPSRRLRMVACKSTAKERWRQVLNEAARIPVKFLLTVDLGLTGSVIAAMVSARIQPFLPGPLIETAYANHAYRASLATVATLLESLTASSRPDHPDA